MKDGADSESPTNHSSDPLVVEDDGAGNVEPEQQQQQRGTSKNSDNMNTVEITTTPTTEVITAENCLLVSFS